MRVKAEKQIHTHIEQAMSHKKQLIRSEADPLCGKGSLSPLYEEQI
jgi:hypothetical protein